MIITFGLCHRHILLSGALFLLIVKRLDTVQDFSIKLGIKPRMHQWEISIFLRNNVIVRPTKIMNNLLKVGIKKNQTNLSEFFFCEEYWI